jgi:hypothetical protein
MRFLLLLLLPTLAHAFTLNNSIGARFKDDNVSVRVGINPTPCTNVDLNEVAELLNESVDAFWNTVPTSRLLLKPDGSENTGDDDYYTGYLCLIGGSCAGTPVPETSDIIVTCNNNNTNFPGGSSLLALTLPNVIKGKDIKGAVVLINDTNDSFDNLSRDKKIGVIAHEIGHAIGLGHSDESAALMYYRVVPVRENLGRDDMKGVTYLYGSQMDLFGAGCFLGTVAMKSNDDRQPPTGGAGGFILTLLGGLLLALGLSRLKLGLLRSSRA